METKMPPASTAWSAYLPWQKKGHFEIQFGLIKPRILSPFKTRVLSGPGLHAAAASSLCARQPQSVHLPCDKWLWPCPWNWACSENLVILIFVFLGISKKTENSVVTRRRPKFSSSLKKKDNSLDRIKRCAAYPQWLISVGEWWGRDWGGT